MTEEKLPPQSTESECAALGAAIQSSRVLAEVAAVVTADDFYSPRNRAVFEALCDMDAAGESISPISVSEELLRRGQLERIGGASYLMDLVAFAPVGWDASGMAEIVARKSFLRRSIELSQRIGRMAHAAADEVDLDALFESMRDMIDEAESGKKKGIEVAEPAELVKEALASYRSPAPPSTPMGLLDLDRLTGGMKPGQLIVVAARPGVGKSVLSLNAAMNVAEQGLTSVFFSLEMSKQEITDRCLANLGSVDLGPIEARTLNDLDLQRLDRAGERFEEYSMRIIDDATIGGAGIRAASRDLSRASGGLGLVVVDYLQLTHATDSRISREQQVSGFSRGLKLLAKELQVPVIAVSQLNRGPEQRQDKKPTLADLRESGAIEQDADKVLLLHHDESSEVKAASELEVIVAKNRQGRTGSVSLAWSPQYARVANLSRQVEPMRGVA
ncbi:replicative DNA helicase [Saccharopolyspora sp. 6T]|uniref:replicative DNA helicase n=1 Tax=Saccharopolyspora sp. 6T TaxID=2877238 RepID=UPI001CD3DD3B|nr:replicative DNA helicase [Saccharopolyspora sp. 6T]MCA1185781.1 replicative DNA helicase [Saccharopolyspora sp. 6T]